MSQSVIVVGGSGTFGTAFTRLALAQDWVSKLVIFSRDELKQSQMREQFPDARMRFLLGDVRDMERLRLAFRGIETVILAAAMKQVPACEQHPWEATQTNVIGAWNVALAAIQAGVRTAVFLSTDKAVDATTLYGASKFMAERLWLRANVYGAGLGTRLVATRYGNILGSRGSVVPQWRQQVAEGQPVTITDPTATRFWMTIDQAVALVWQAQASLRKGEIAIPKLGAASLQTLAAVVAPNAPLDITGLRGAEKLHEVLTTVTDAPWLRDMGTHYVLLPQARDWEDPLPDRGLKMPAGFALTSATAPQLTPDQLAEMLA